MLVFELSHLFFRSDGELIYSPKNLGLFYSYENAQKAIQYYCIQPGFRENTDAFSIQRKEVLGDITNDTIFEVIIYLHSNHYEFEVEIELGLYGDKNTAQTILSEYCNENVALLSIKNLVVERIINKCLIDRKQWSEGFLISE